ncbi:MAG: DUF3179 domain-containing protein [Pseudomonadota bacterium]
MLISLEQANQQIRGGTYGRLPYRIGGLGKTAKSMKRARITNPSLLRNPWTGPGERSATRNRLARPCRAYLMGVMFLLGGTLGGTLSSSLIAAITYAADDPKRSVSHSGESLAADFLALILATESDSIGEAISAISETWQPSVLPMAIEAYQYSRSERARAFLGRKIDELTGLKAADDINRIYYWLWNQDIEPSSDYGDFKAGLYRYIDPAFEAYFLDRQATARIRLDEIRWGGVRQDGIPPLRNPKMIAAEEAEYLEDDNIVFGITVNGDARAYPKRILAWHEMFTDTIGGTPIAGVYCTLCGTVIPYRTEWNGKSFTLGTSGFLYRSNKLMYDRATQSLWSTERGEPVLGPLVDKGISLAFESVVTTTWGEWKRRNPRTTVLALNTGYQRDYGEGAAYRDYFGDDELMFNTPFSDQRLANKREVLALRFAGAPKQQLAIDTEFLRNNPVYTNRIGQQEFVVLTDVTGANRVYDPGTVTFIRYDGRDKATDSTGENWTVSEESLVSDSGQTLQRLPYHRAFWFGWQAAFPQTELVK